MTAKRILVTGAAGQLGQAVRDVRSPEADFIFTDVVIPPELTPTTEVMDITDRKSIGNILDETQPDCILNLAAMTDVDGCELKPELANRINVESVKNLRELFSGLIVHISTDYVFDGLAGPYHEDDPVHPLSVYGQTKRDSELVLQNAGGPFCIIRTNVVFDYTRTRASFVKWVVDSLKAGQPIRVVDDQWNNPTWTVDLAEKLLVLIQRDAHGLYHYGGADYLNRYQFSHRIADKFHLDKALISRISTSELNQAAPRPLKGGLHTDTICRKFNFAPLPLNEALDAIKQRLGT
ncbi:MAG: SDR family oxidoreductase [FCB group bacterium]|nr:SDR family oxidoreductase [FCB group bacterium]